MRQHRSITTSADFKPGAFDTVGRSKASATNAPISSVLFGDHQGSSSASFGSISYAREELAAEITRSHPAIEIDTCDRGADAGRCPLGQVPRPRLEGNSGQTCLRAGDPQKIEQSARGTAVLLPQKGAFAGRISLRRSLERSENHARPNRKPERRPRCRD